MMAEKVNQIQHKSYLICDKLQVTQGSITALLVPQTRGIVQMEALGHGAQQHFAPWNSSPQEFVCLWFLPVFNMLIKNQKAKIQYPGTQTAQSWSGCHRLCIFKAQVCILGLSHVNSMPDTHPPHQHQDVWD